MAKQIITGPRGTQDVSPYDTVCVGEERENESGKFLKTDLKFMRKRKGTKITHCY